MSIRRKLFVCAATVALTASGGSYAVAAVHHARPHSGTARPFGGPNFTGIYLSTWGTSHVTFSDAFKRWLTDSHATVTAQAPLTLDANHGGFTMRVSRETADRLDERGRMVYPGALVISLPPKTSGHAMAAKRKHEKQRTLRFGPFYIRVMPDVSWSAALSVNGGAAVGEVELATADYPEVLAAGGTPSPSGFRAVRVPFHLSQDAAELFARAVHKRTALVAGSPFGTLTPQFDHVPTQD